MGGENEAVIQQLYASLSKKDGDGMASCYAEKCQFQDPVFGRLHNEEVSAMWQMLTKRAKGNVDVSIHKISTSGNKGTASITASYEFSKTGRMINNHIHASFVFENGKITQQKDEFDLWKWSRMALGMPGVLLGWSPLIQNKIRFNASDSLRKFMS
jgi:hypothetical protein